MEDLQNIETRQLYFMRYSQQGQSGSFTLKLPEELEISGTRRHFLDVKECVIPRILVHVKQSNIRLNEVTDLRIPRMDVCDINEVIETINAHLPNDFIPLKFFPANTERPLPYIKVTLQPGQCLRMSDNLADLLFENKTFLRNINRVKQTAEKFKVRNDFLANTYYLICDALEMLQVGQSQLPLLNSLSVKYLGKEKNTNLSWDTSDLQEKAFLRTGSLRELVLRISDIKGQTVKLGEGLFFLHLRLCT